MLLSYSTGMIDSEQGVYWNSLLLREPVHSILTNLKADPFALSACTKNYAYIIHVSDLLTLSDEYIHQTSKKGFHVQVAARLRVTLTKMRKFHLG
jgi:hypothetical protein